MQILRPIVHETIWGGNKLTPYSNSSCQSIGHLYSFIDNRSMTSEIEAGTYAGRSIHEWFSDKRGEYGLEHFSELPVLAAMVEAKETLSIQVHPDDGAARRIDGLPFGKNESFYTLCAPRGGKMYNGCTANNIDEVRTAIDSGNVLDIVDMMPCEEGDYVYIEGGTLHAATAGSLHFEVEENCERTFRLHDFGRQDKDGNMRPLQVERALECLDVGKRSVARKYGDGPIEERMYTTRLIKGRSTYVNDGPMFSFAVMVRGQGNIDGVDILPGRAILLEPGDEIDVTGAEYIVVTPKAVQVQAAAF